ncbi:MAG: hypothetical protein LBU40_04565, partial [Methanobrevibacter sp.]|nr:hypothetical protein [Methanobrevibacter sp.]
MFLEAENIDKLVANLSKQMDIEIAKFGSSFENKLWELDNKYNKYFKEEINEFNNKEDWIFKFLMLTYVPES